MQTEEPGQAKRMPLPKYSDRFQEFMKNPSCLAQNLSSEQSLSDRPSAMSQQLFAPTDQHNELEGAPMERQNSFFFLRVKTIGVGAHSFVYLVQQQNSKVLYAQKSIVKSHAHKHSDQLLNQIKILSSISHINLVKLYHIQDDQSYINLIMEYAQDSLFQLKNCFKTFKEKEIVEVLRQLMNGMKYLHERGIVHADIKLQNIMICNGTIKLCDFGYAHRSMENSPGDKGIVGTLEYLSPEYVQGRNSGWKRDVWAIGILAFEMLVGKSPFEGLKENEKWAKLVKNSQSQYLAELMELQNQSGIRSEKIQDFISKTLCNYEARFSVQKLLQLEMFR